MKIGLLILLTAGFSSCEMVKGWFEVDFETTLNGDLDIDIQESAKKSTNDDTPFNSSATVDPFDDEEIAEYQDNITNIEITGIIAEVLSVNKTSVIFRSGTTISVSGDGKTASWKMGNDWTIIKGTELNLEDVGGTYDLVKEILDTFGEFEVSAQGVCSESGVSITLRIGIHTLITANPL